MGKLRELALEAEKLGYALVRKDELRSTEQAISEALDGMTTIMQSQISTNALLVELILELSDETSESAVLMRTALQKHLKNRSR